MEYRRTSERPISSTLHNPLPLQFTLHSELAIEIGFD
jgi:hypothetical protein